MTGELNMINKTMISSLLIVGALSAFASAQDLSPEEIADQLCGQPKAMIEGVTTTGSMIDLARYFKNLPVEGHPLSKCRNKYIDSLVSLEKVLTAGNSNVCGDAKVSAIEDFNRKFLSTTKRDLKQQGIDHLKAPKLVKVFFAHYAFLVSSRCKQVLLEHLTEDTYQIIDENDQPADTSFFDDILEKFSRNLAINVVKRGYADLVLPWKLVDNLSPKKSSKFVRDAVIDDQHPRPIRISIRVHDADKLQSFQQICADVFKPAYSDLILPIVRLVGLGLYEDNEPLEEAIGKNAALKRMFGAAQLCETILPIEAFGDKSLKPDQTVALTVEKANSLRASLPSAPADAAVEAADQQVVDEQDVPEVESIELESLKDHRAALAMAKAMTANRKVHEQVVTRMLKIASAEVKSRISGKFSRETSPDGTITEIGLEGESEGDGEGEEEAEENHGLVRQKRGFWGKSFYYFLKGVDIFAKIVWAVIVVIACVAFGIAISPFWLTYKAIKWVRRTLKARAEKKEIEKRYAELIKIN